MKNNEKPILFTGKMVNAILENRKAVTRRLLYPQPSKQFAFFEYNEDFNVFQGFTDSGNKTFFQIRPKYNQGLFLWVKEKWVVVGYDNYSGYEISIAYPADGTRNFNIDLDNEELWNRIVKREEKQLKEDKEKLLTRSSLFLPRAASRLLLKVINVKIERLHELDDTEARLEGCKDREEFIKVWNNINSKNGYSWENNPFVYRIEFERVIKNVY